MRKRAKTGVQRAQVTSVIEGQEVYSFPVPRSSMQKCA